MPTKRNRAAPAYSDAELMAICANWRLLNKPLLTFDRHTLERAVRLERAGRNRAYILLRLHTRLSRVKQREEWAKLVAGDKSAAAS